MHEAWICAEFKGLLRTHSKSILRATNPPYRLIHRLARIANNANLRPCRLTQLTRQNEPLADGEISPVSDLFLQMLRHIGSIEVRFVHSPGLRHDRSTLPVSCLMRVTSYQTTLYPFRHSNTMTDRTTLELLWFLRTLLHAPNRIRSIRAGSFLRRCGQWQAGSSGKGPRESCASRRVS